jgi:hypothetical protein
VKLRKELPKPSPSQTVRVKKGKGGGSITTPKLRISGATARTATKKPRVVVRQNSARVEDFLQ